MNHFEQALRALLGLQSSRRSQQVKQADEAVVQGWTVTLEVPGVDLGVLLGSVGAGVVHGHHRPLCRLAQRLSKGRRAPASVLQVRAGDRVAKCSDARR